MNATFTVTQDRPWKNYQQLKAVKDRNGACEQLHTKDLFNSAKIALQPWTVITLIKWWKEKLGFRRKLKILLFTHYPISTPVMKLIFMAHGIDLKETRDKLLISPQSMPFKSFENVIEFATIFVDNNFLFSAAHSIHGTNSLWR